MTDEGGFGDEFAPALNTGMGMFEADMPDTAGAMLRRLRVRARVDLAVVASALKVSPSTLDALEQDRYEDLPDITFARGLASSICRSFGVDPAPVLELMPNPGTLELDTSRERLNAPFHASSGSGLPMVPSNLSRPLLLIVLALLLAAAVIWVWPSLPVRLGDSAPEPEVPATTEPALGDEPADRAPDMPFRQQAPALLLEPGSESGVVQAPDGDDVAEAEGQLALVESADAVAPDRPTTEAAEDQPGDASQADSQPSDTPAVAAGGSEDLRFVASGDSWVSVRDGTGQSLLGRLLTDGESVGVSGTPPLSVTIGQKEEVTVTVRGEPFDLARFGESAVARFRVD